MSFQISHKIQYLDYYRLGLETKLRKGNVFTSVCQSFCSQGGLPQCMLGYNTPRQTHPPRQTPGHDPSCADTPWVDTPSRRLLLRTVCILLECILVSILNFVDRSITSELLLIEICRIYKIF